LEGGLLDDCDRVSLLYFSRRITLNNDLNNGKASVPANELWYGGGLQSYLEFFVREKLSLTPIV
jgi:hypothetical protein